MKKFTPDCYDIIEPMKHLSKNRLIQEIQLTHKKYFSPQKKTNKMKNKSIA